MPRTRAQGASPGGFKALDMKATRKSTRKRSRDEPIEKKPTPMKRKKHNNGRKGEASTSHYEPSTPQKSQPHLESTEAFESQLEESHDQEGHELVKIKQEPQDEEDHEQEPQEQSQDERSQPTSADEQSVQEDRVEEDSETTPEYLAIEATESREKAPATPKPNNRNMKDAKRTPSTYPKLVSRLSRLSSQAAEGNKVREAEEKALSECDDDEWEGRIDGELSAVAGAKSRGSREFTTNGMLADAQETPSNRPESITWKDPSRKNTPSSKSNDAPSSSKEPSNKSTRSRYNSRDYIILKNPDIIAMFSAANELFENNPALPIPTPSQITDLLCNFALMAANPSKASPFPTRASTEAPSTEESSTSIPESLSGSDVHDHTSRKRVRAKNDERGRNEDGNKRVKFEVPYLSDSESEEEGKETATEDSEMISQTSVKQESTAGSWADMFNPRHLLRVSSPIKYFNRSDTSRNRSESPVRPPAQAISVDTPMQLQPSQAEAPATISRRGLAALVRPLIPAPKFKGHYLPHPNGRLDIHLPMSLRGVQYKDLPAEYQAVSSHMNPTPPTDPDALAEWMEAQKHKLFLEPFEGFDDDPAPETVINDETPSKKSSSTPTTSVSDGATGSGKKRKVVVAKVYEGRVGPSSFGMPENIYDSDSEEEISILDHESPEIQQKVASPPKEGKWVSWTERMRILKESVENPDQQANVTAQQPDASASKPDVNIYQDEDADNELSQDEVVREWPSLDKYLPEDDEDVSSEDEWDILEGGHQPGTSFKYDMITIRRETKSQTERILVMNEYKEYHRRKQRYHKANGLIALKEAAAMGEPTEDWRSAAILKREWPKGHWKGTVVKPYPQFEFLVGKVIGDPSRASPYTGRSRLPSSIKRMLNALDQLVADPQDSVPLFASSSSRSAEDGELSAESKKSSGPRVTFGPNQYFDAPVIPFEAPPSRSRSPSPHRSCLKKPGSAKKPVLSSIVSQQTVPTAGTAHVIDGHDSGKHDKENLPTEDKLSKQKGLFTRDGSPEKTLQELIREQKKKAQQHLPKTPSRLQESTTVSPSPSSADQQPLQLGNYPVYKPEEELQDEPESQSMSQYAVDILSEEIEHNLDWIKNLDKAVYDDVTTSLTNHIPEAVTFVESMNPLFDDDFRMAAHVTATSHVDELLDRMDPALKAQRIEEGETRAALQIEANKKYLAAFSQRVGNGLKEGPHWEADLHVVDFGPSVTD